MRMIDADALYRRVKTECNPYGKPSIGFKDGKSVMKWIKDAPTVGGWVSVKDRLPEPDKSVLLFVEAEYGGNYQVMAWLIKGGDIDECVWDSNDEEFLMGGGTITHWMPLPEPPKEV